MSRVKVLVAGGLTAFAVVSIGCSSGSRKAPLPIEGDAVAPQGHAAATATAQLALPGWAAADAAFEGDVWVALYDHLAAIFAQHAEDCAKMRAASTAALVMHRPAVQAWGASLSKLTPGQAAEVEGRMRASAGERLDAFREALDKAMLTCSDELTPVLQEMSSLVGKPQQ